MVSTLIGFCGLPATEKLATEFDVPKSMPTHSGVMMFAI